jgi:hypothetical protein
LHVLNKEEEEEEIKFIIFKKLVLSDSGTI